MHKNRAFFFATLFVCILPRMVSAQLLSVAEKKPFLELMHQHDKNENLTMITGENIEGTWYVMYHAVGNKKLTYDEYDFFKPSNLGFDLHYVFENTEGTCVFEELNVPFNPYRKDLVKFTTPKFKVDTRTNSVVMPYAEIELKLESPKIVDFSHCKLFFRTDEDVLVCRRHFDQGFWIFLTRTPTT